MRLINKISTRGIWTLSAVFTMWSVAFYLTIINDINDETDDSLEEYSSYIITRMLAGEPLPQNSNGTNNTYYINEVSREYATSTERIRYADEMVFIESIEDNEPARVLYTIFKDANGNYYELTVAIPTIDKADLKKSVLIGIILLFFLLFLATILINLVTYRRTMKPLYALLSWIDEYRPGAANPPLSIETDVDEFLKLNEAAIKNARRHEAMYEEQREFIDNVSHEMQTPIAICMNRLEMIMDSPEISQEEGIKEISKILRTLSYMSRLNKNLLMIARIDNGQYLDNQTVGINTLAENIASSLSDVYSYKQIEVIIALESRLSYCMNPVLAESLLANLIKNAFVYTAQGSKVTIHIEGRTLIISNSALQGALDSKRLFNRFYREGGHEGSTGLGLHISHKICALYGIDISYSYHNCCHQFSLTFP